MEQMIKICHVSVDINTDFERFTGGLERCLGRFHDSFYEDLETAPAKVRERLEKAAGEEGLMLFTARDHGKLLNIPGAPKKAKQYVLGNPLIALKMTARDIRAGLYAPLRMLVYETEDHTTRVEYDRPSSLLGQFNDPEIMTVARSLDVKIENLIKRAETAAKAAIAIGG